MKPKMARRIGKSRRSVNAKMAVMAPTLLEIIGDMKKS